MKPSELQIKEIESAQNVKVLFACEAGSRAWGLSSPYSDKDVGLIYYRPLEWYLSVNEKPLTINLSQHTDYDGFGWDIKKALQLLLQSNAIIFDWLQASDPYIGSTVTIETFKKIAQQCFDVRKVIHHYLGLGNHLIHKNKAKEDIQLKAYLLLIRSTLAALWVKEKATPPPVLFSELLTIAESQPMALLPIHKMVMLKKQARPEKRIKKIPALDQFIKDNRRLCFSYAETLPLKKEIPLDLVEQLFKAVILQPHYKSVDFDSSFK